MLELERIIIESAGDDLKESESHGLDHLNRVMGYARQLYDIYSGDLEVLTASVFLHDAGRSNKDLHKEESRKLSAQIASQILGNIGFPSEKTQLVVNAILEHDQPELSPSTMEGKILKDADFLAGMGAIGILRSTIWTVESGGTRLDLVDILQNKMRARIDGLEFPESRLTAEKQYALVELFLNSLDQAPVLEINV